MNPTKNRQPNEFDGINSELDSNFQRNGKQKTERIRLRAFSERAARYSMRHVNSARNPDNRICTACLHKHTHTLAQFNTCPCCMSCERSSRNWTGLNGINCVDSCTRCNKLYFSANLVILLNFSFGMANGKEKERATEIFDNT